MARQLGIELRIATKRTHCAFPECSRQIELGELIVHVGDGYWAHFAHPERFRLWVGSRPMSKTEWRGEAANY